MCLRSLMIASAFVFAFSGIAGTASAQDGPRENTDRPGNDFRNVALRGNSGACGELCRKTRGCRAWTFVKPGFHGRICPLLSEERGPGRRRAIRAARLA